LVAHGGQSGIDTFATAVKDGERDIPEHVDHVLSKPPNGSCNHVRTR
jgi:hypothetical protein